ncbi:hypothetical protein RclHR1_06560007 [Rhizophagus clarus]|uniref:Uncharacterized protein n=1 Tax=Rhizophagus clarus TaxID=94130 RepID=A0A2Z6RSS1_9GLOM|nr:hypothetical protein RclHR1_06560007 [Rhizophagus clarus]
MKPEAVNRLVLATDEAVEKFLQQPIILLPLVVYTVKAYFSYKMYFLCGIPKITLEGTLEDWVNLQEKVNKLRQLNLDMDFWLDKLDPVIWKLIETYKGEIDEEFWTKIISLNYFGSGGDFAINGWMTAFFPYRNDGKILENNSIEPNDIPNGRVEVPFTTDTGFSLKFVSGFLGTQQKTLENSNELVISPVICWLVIDNKDSEVSRICPELFHVRNLSIWFFCYVQNLSREEVDEDDNNSIDQEKENKEDDDNIEQKEEKEDDDNIEQEEEEEEDDDIRNFFAYPKIDDDDNDNNENIHILFSSNFRIPALMLDNGNDNIVMVMAYVLIYRRKILGQRIHSTYVMTLRKIVETGLNEQPMASSALDTFEVE